MIEIILIVLILSFIIILFTKKQNNMTLKKNYVFINKKTKKYHQKECPYSKNLESITLEMAIKRGYSACKICKKR